MRLQRFIVFLMIHVLMCSEVFAQNIDQDYVKISSAKNNIVVDGVVNKEEWNSASRFYFHEYNPNWGTQDSLTVMYVTFDRRNLYIAFEAFEPNVEKIIKRSLIRDRWYGDDYVSFHIDPNITKEKGFIFSVFPEGSRFDMAVSNDAIPIGNSTFNTSYDMIWTSKTAINDKGWTAEYKIPIANLRFEKNSEGNVVAGISGLRSQNHINRQVSFPKVPQNIPNAIESPSLKRKVIFDGLTPNKQLQITPYTIVSNLQNYQLNNVENQYQQNTAKEFDAGLDLRYGISSSLTLDLTLNTDFAQVEIDDQVVNISDRVNIFLPEKRKFFQEQAGLFDFNAGLFSQLFYSRTIGINQGRLTPIIGGVRLTGAINRTEIGFLSLQTEGINFDNELQIPSENFSVLRLRNKVLNDKSFIGFMATNRVRKGYFNTALGIDGVLSLPNDIYMIPSISTTFETQGSNLFDSSRISVYMEKRKQDGWFYRLAYEYSGEEYNPSMGFLLREKHHNFYKSLSYGKFNTEKKNGLFRYSRFTFLNSDLYYKTDFSEVITWTNRSFWRGRFFNGDEVSVFGQIQYESLDVDRNFTDQLVVPKGNYLFYYFGASYSSGNQRSIQLPMSLEYGRFFDGTNYRMTVRPTFNMGKHLNLMGSWQANYIEFKNRNENDWIHIAELKLNWAYDLHLSGSLIGQYNSISNQFLTSFRMRYNFRDGHDFYLVLNADYNIERDFMTPQLPIYNNQMFTIKYLYTFFK